MGARSKYTPERVKRILEAIRQGATYELAAAYGGIHYDTFNEWRQDPEKGEFSEAIKLAEGEAAMKWLKKIDAAANRGEWQAAAWKLERRYPESYGRRQADLTISGPEGGPIPIRAFNPIAALTDLAPGPVADRHEPGADPGGGDG